MEYDIKYKSKHILGFIPDLVVKYRKKGSVFYNETGHHPIDLFALINYPNIYITAGINHYCDLELTSYEKRMTLLDKYVEKAYNGNTDMYLDDSARYYTENDIESNAKAQTADDICNKFTRHRWHRITMNIDD